VSSPASLAPSAAAGGLGVCHLERLWSAAMLARRGRQPERPGDEDLDRVVMNALGLGLHQTLRYLLETGPSFAEFEAWIVATAGPPDPDRVARLNADVLGTEPPERVRRRLDELAASEPVLTAAELDQWHEHGYVVLRRAVEPVACAAAAAAVLDAVGADPEDPETWYRDAGELRHGVMVELIQHPALEANRRARRIHKAFAELWETPDLWVTADRCGFHPPQRPDCPFPGPDLHWDLDFDRPLVFGTQGILYLNDTPAEQGALTLVPGFHRRLAGWLDALEPGADPQQQDLHALGSVPVAGAAGDLVIWHQALPHGSRPNLGTRPRVVQYVNMIPGPRVTVPRL
jgi:hypothetical protein